MTLNELKDFQNCLSGEEIWIVADGLSCPENIKTDKKIIAVNHGYKNVSGKPFVLVFNDSHWIKEKNCSDPTPLRDVAEYVIHGPNAGVPQHNNIFRTLLRGEMTNDIRMGIYGMSTSGLAALSLAILMGASKIRLFGYDYRIFTDEEAQKLFGRIGVHRSQALHRNTNKTKEKVYLQKIKDFAVYEKAKIDIINHSMYSNLPYFKKELHEIYR